MPRRFLAVAFAASLCLVPFLLGLSWGAKDEAAPAAPAVDEAPFSGKILAIYTSEHAETNSYIVEEARFKTIGAKRFLVAKSAATGAEDWTRELPISIAWDSIVTVIEFESLKQFKERSKEEDVRAGL